ncbi:DNA-binding protein [Vibrio parahaemolyticus]|uniref:DNA-binding protein n=1 Tax=Vibrio TaxID=662 RepID=UPI0017804BFC|nr:DNA-binding protein [Vibrio parahaemolyticus]EJE4199515.1 DNA-binding protein [Vibrio cholerae]EGU0149834.1 DNA-binding protein [Vibrio parahaemolyticus]MBD6969651.1 DNA-binding protein [Vibrio parahaemolyticus]MBD6974353.1 DNA-binding protein [Vibrio parahaemolyticus]MCR9712611.1 DNA-binding protein [Vibrio parahaemolyticus]
MLLKLIDYTKDAHPNGNVKGKAVYSDLFHLVENHQSIDTFGISLDGIVATDASFPRESVMALAKHFSGVKFFYLSDIDDEDLIDNWTYAAIAKEQPMTIWNDGNASFIGPEMTKSVKELVDYMLKKKKVTTSQVSKDFDITTQNASTRLKNIFKLGYVKRVEEVAESGGIEFIYKLIDEF